MASAATLTGEPATTRARESGVTLLGIKSVSKETNSWLLSTGLAKIPTGGNSSGKASEIPTESKTGVPGDLKYKERYDRKRKLRKLRKWGFHDRLELLHSQWFWCDTQQ